MKKTSFAYFLMAAASLASFPTSANSTLTFRNGIDGYAGTQDTELWGGTPDTVLGVSEASISIDGDNGGYAGQALIRFDQLFGNGAGQIKAGDTIVSATLTLNINNEGSGFTVYDMLRDWSQAGATWNSLGEGVQADGTEAAMTEITHFGQDDSSKHVFNGPLVIDVTHSLQLLQAGQLPGYGWAFIPFTPNGTNGIDFDSSEAYVLGDRPLLSVEVAPVPEPETYALMLAGLGLVGALARRRASR